MAKTTKPKTAKGKPEAAPNIQFYRPKFPRDEIGRAMREMDKQCVHDFVRAVGFARYLYRLCPELVTSKKFPSLPRDIQDVYRASNSGNGPSEPTWFPGYALLHPNYPKYLYGEAVSTGIRSASYSIACGSVLMFPPKTPKAA